MIITNQAGQRKIVFLFGETVIDIEKQIIRVMLEHMQGNRTQTARALKMPLRTLVYKIKKYKLPPREAYPHAANRD